MVKKVLNLKERYEKLKSNVTNFKMEGRLKRRMNYAKKKLLSKKRDDKDKVIDVLGDTAEQYFNKFRKTTDRLMKAEKELKEEREKAVKQVFDKLPQDLPHVIKAVKDMIGEETYDATKVILSKQINRR